MKVKELQKALKKLNSDANVFICIADVRDSDSEYVRTTSVMPNNMVKMVTEGKVQIRPDYMTFEGQNGVVIYTEKVTL